MFYQQQVGREEGFFFCWLELVLVLIKRVQGAFWGLAFLLGFPPQGRFFFFPSRFSLGEAKVGRNIFGQRASGPTQISRFKHGIHALDSGVWGQSLGWGGVRKI